MTLQSSHTKKIHTHTHAHACRHILYYYVSIAINIFNDFLSSLTGIATTAGVNKLEHS